MANYVYIDGFDRHILCVFDRQLNLVDRIVLSADVDAGPYFGLGNVGFDGENLFLAGFGDAKWVVYSIKVISSQQSVEVVSVLPLFSCECLLLLIISFVMYRRRVGH